MFRTILINTTISTLFIVSSPSYSHSYAHNTSSLNDIQEESYDPLSNKTEQSELIITSASPQDILSSLEKAEIEPVIEDVSDLDEFLFTTSAELGFLYKTGNSQTGDIKAGIDFRFEEGQWLSLLDLDLLVKKADVIDDLTGEAHFETTEEQWSVVSQTNYSLGENDKNYIYGNLSIDDKTIGSYSKQKSVSSGWGRHWYQSPTSSFWADIGPGYKSDILRVTDIRPAITLDTWIVQAQALYLTKLGEFVEFKQFFSTKYALSNESNTISKAESSITTKLISTLQLRFTFTLDHNSIVEEDVSKVDTQTAVTLVYSF